MRFLLLFLAVIMASALIGCVMHENITGDAVAEEAAEEIPSEEGPEIEVYFCPLDECESKLHEFISSAEKSVHCALFELNLESIKKIMYEKSKEIDVKLVVDEQYYDEVEELDFARKDTSSQLSHNKFCVIDGSRVFTGSFNPTERGAYFNNNNMLLIDSKILASNYEDEFEELWNGSFGKGAEVKNPALFYNGKAVQNYFCPDDSCADRIIDELKKANRSIYFMTFSFTHKGIGTAIALRLNSGVDVKGVYEYKNMKDSTYNLLNYQGADVKADDNPYNMHHKVFIIDEKTVITGSFNPTAGGDNRNDENIVIIEDAELAKKFIKEFVHVWNFNSTKLERMKEAKDVILYEIMYDAEGSDEGNEYVALKNIGNHTVDLKYWRLSDGKNNFVLNGNVSAGEDIKFMPSFSLKNSEGLVILRDRSMNNVDYAAYEGMWNITAKEGQKLVRNDNLWVNCEECWIVG
jgi:phosphatidylserine/phosphatidylglycerophosphate/cardiolipin synthase-like enzyme